MNARENERRILVERDRRCQFPSLSLSLSFSLSLVEITSSRAKFGNELSMILVEKRDDCAFVRTRVSVYTRIVFTACIYG